MTMTILDNRVTTEIGAIVAKVLTNYNYTIYVAMNFDIDMVIFPVPYLINTIWCHTLNMLPHSFLYGRLT